MSRHSQRRHAVDPKARAMQAAPSSEAAVLAKHDKWIVVTTINYPTDTIKKLAVAPGWKVVVVADLKTPKDWALANVDFISVEDQDSLQYEILSLLPKNHYGWGAALDACMQHAHLLLKGTSHGLQGKEHSLCASNGGTGGAGGRTLATCGRSSMGRRRCMRRTMTTS